MYFYLINSVMRWSFSVSWMISTNRIFCDDKSFSSRLQKSNNIYQNLLEKWNLYFGTHTFLKWDYIMHNWFWLLKLKPTLHHEQKSLFTNTYWFFRRRGKTKHFKWHKRQNFWYWHNWLNPLPPAPLLNARCCDPTLFLNWYSPFFALKRKIAFSETKLLFQEILHCFFLIVFPLVNPIQSKRASCWLKGF